MKKQPTIILIGLLVSSVFFVQCSNQSDNGTKETATAGTSAVANGGYASQVEWGHHIVLAGGCGDCHTPKKMGPMGPEDDSTLLLSGHPAQMPLPDIDQASLQSKGVIATQTLTAWIGPWGVSYAANLTPDSTGTGGWKEEQFIYALRNGISKGLPGNRHLLPPMPWPSIKNFSDDELKAVFAYLRTIKPVKNVVPAPLPPAKK